MCNYIFSFVVNKVFYIGNHFRRLHLIMNKILHQLAPIFHNDNGMLQIPSAQKYEPPLFPSIIQVTQIEAKRRTLIKIDDKYSQNCFKQRLFIHEYFKIQQLHRQGQYYNKLTNNRFCSIGGRHVFLKCSC